jgi:hypothetical protein
VTTGDTPLAANPDRTLFILQNLGEAGLGVKYAEAYDDADDYHFVLQPGDILFEYAYKGAVCIVTGTPTYTITEF